MADSRAGLERGLTVVRHLEEIPVATLSRTVSSLIFLCSFLGPAGVTFAQERPYFVTYDDQLEKRGELEIELLTTSGNVRDENRRYVAPWTEIEYGVTSWWTAELYIEGVTFGGAGSAFTGWRWENRFRPIKGDHVINPVLYVEYKTSTKRAGSRKRSSDAAPRISSRSSSWPTYAPMSSKAA